MCDKRNYSLLSADFNCTLQNININKSNFDLTSIVNALENNEHPSTLFFEGNVNTRSEELEHDKLVSLVQNIDNIRLWLDQTLQPSMQVMQRKDITQCLKKLHEVQDLILYMMRASKKISNKGNTRKKYECICGACNKSVNISDRNCNACPLLSQGRSQMSGALVCNALTHTVIQHNHIPRETNVSSNGSGSSSSSDVSSTNHSKTGIQVIVKNIRGSSKLCMYNIHVRNIIYPPKMVQQICTLERNFTFYSTQNFEVKRYRCLLCKSDMYNESAIYQHTKGQRHRHALTDANAVDKVKNYHRIFSSLPTEFQRHQTCFIPFYKIPLVSCLVCRVQVRENHLVEHLFTAKHAQQLYTKKFMKYHLFYEMLVSLGVEGSEEESSDISSKASLVQTNKLLAAIRKPVTNRTEEYAISDDDTDADLSEMSMKSHVIYNSGHSAVAALDVISTASEHMLELPAPLSVVQNIETVVKESVVHNSEPNTGNDSGESTSVNIRNAAVSSSHVNNTEPITTKSTAEKQAMQEEKNKKSSETNKAAVKREHNIILAVSTTSRDIFDLLEHRFQVHRPYLHCINTNVVCSLCTVQFTYNILEIRRHVSSSKHMKNAQKAIGEQVKHTHFCDLCYKYANTAHTWYDHLMGIEHRQRKESIIRNNHPKGGIFTEYECVTCRYVIFGNKFSVNKHLKEVLAVTKKKKKEVKLPQNVDRLLKNDLYFNDEVARLCRESQKVLNSRDLNWKCCEAIQNALEPVFGKCKAYPFGSRVSGLGNIESDLDVFVDTGMMYSGMLSQDAESQARFVMHTAKALKKHLDFTDIFSIPNARTPIVQVFHRGTDLDCDLSFRHGLSVENTEFLRLCIDVQPPLKPLILILKMWSHMCKMNERISTYALSMMSIFYFQSKGYLPSLKQIRELDTAQPQIIGGWTTFCYNKPITELQQQILTCDKTTKELMCEFFGYYLQFKFETEVICPLLGCTVPKVDFHEDNGLRLPPDMEEYVTKINENSKNEVFRSLSAMCIQDPFDLSHNLTKACPESVVKKFTTLCVMCNAILSK